MSLTWASLSSCRRVWPARKWAIALCVADWNSVAMPVIGTAVTVGLTITGQQLVSVLVDRYGLLGLPQRSPSLLRIGGVVLLVVGVILIRVV